MKRLKKLTDIWTLLQQLRNAGSENRVILEPIPNGRWSVILLREGDEIAFKIESKWQPLLTAQGYVENAALDAIAEVMEKESNKPRFSSDATPEGEVLREGGNCSLFVLFSENPHLI